MSDEESRMLLRAQLFVVKSAVEAMNEIRKDYVARGLDKERDFLDEFLLK